MENPNSEENRALEVRLFRRNETIQRLEFPEFLNCPSKTCTNVSKENYSNHINTCR